MAWPPTRTATFAQVSKASQLNRSDFGINFNAALETGLWSQRRSPLSDIPAIKNVHRTPNLWSCCSQLAAPLHKLGIGRTARSAFTSISDTRKPEIAFSPLQR